MYGPGSVDNIDMVVGRAGTGLAPGTGTGHGPAPSHLQRNKLFCGTNPSAPKTLSVWICFRAAADHANVINHKEQRDKQKQ
eukprot:scaffold26648_cov151-Skeletonema_menzelii.AAC.5